MGYVSPRQRRRQSIKRTWSLGVADWRIIRPDRHNVRLSSLSCLVQMMTDQYEVTFVRLTFGEPQKVDGIIALGVFSEKEIDFSTLSVLCHRLCELNQHNYEFDQVQVDFERGQEQMVSYCWIRSGTPAWGISAVFTTGPTDASHPPSGRHPAHLGEAWSVRSPNLPCGGNQSRKWLCSGQEGRGRAYLGGSGSVGQ